MNYSNDVYGMCPHGNNMALCDSCREGREKIFHTENYCYFIEHKKTGKWMTEKELTYELTSDPLLAMKFDGDGGKTKATLYLYLNQMHGALKGFIVTEHEFVG